MAPSLAARLPRLLPLLAAAPQPPVLGGPPPPLAVRLESAVEEALLERVEGLVRHVEAEGDPELVGQTRNFGEEHKYEGGHSVIFLHTHADSQAPGLVDLLWGLGTKADAKAGWGIGPAFAGSGRPGLRCLELIEYFAKPGAADAPEAPETPLSNSLGWHTDGHTLLTVAVLISRPGADFAGGGLEVRRRDGDGERHESFAPVRGDAVVWRGWDYHRVRPVSAGLRRVLVAEFWEGPDVTGTETRLMDFEEGFRGAVLLDPSSAYLHRHLAWKLYDREELDGAAESCVFGLAADPSDVDLPVLLAMVRQRQGRFDEAATTLEGALALRPGDTVALMALAEVRGSQGNDTEMERCYVSAVESDPQNVHALTALAEHKERQGRLDEAGQAYRRALELDAEDEAAVEGLERVEASAKRSRLVGPSAAAAAACSSALLWWALRPGGHSRAKAEQ